MLTHTEVVKRSVKYAGLLLVLDVAASLTPFFRWIDTSSLGMLGNLLLVEVAVLFITAGILDISSSAGMTGLRKLFSTNVEYSTVNRKDSERHALVFLFAALPLLAVMILLAAYDLSMAAS